MENNIVKHYILRVFCTIGGKKNRKYMRHRKTA